MIVPELFPFVAITSVPLHLKSHFLLPGNPFMGVLKNNNFQGHIDQRNVAYQRPRAVQKSSSGPVLSHVEGKAAVIFARRAYFQYVSTEK